MIKTPIPYFDTTEIVMANEKTFPIVKPKLQWLMWAISVLFVFYKYVIEVSPSIMTKDLMLDFSLNASSLGHLAASFYYSYMLMQIPAGILIDSIGTKKITTIAIALCAMATLIFSKTTSVEVAFASRFIIGLCATFAILNTLKISSNWFHPSKFALLTGLMLSLGMLGSIFGQTPLAYFLHNFGWRESITYLSWIGFALALLFLLVLREKPKHLRHYNVTQEPKHKTPLLQSLIAIIKKPQVWLISIFSGLAFAPVMAFGGLWGVSFLETKFGFSAQKSASMTSLIFLGFALGAPLFGWLSNRIGKRKPFMFAGILTSFCFLTYVIYAPTLTFFWGGTCLFLFGFSVSAFLISFTVIHEINSPLVTATAIGFMNLFNALFGAITDPLVGAVLDSGFGRSVVSAAFTAKDYEIALSFLPIYLLACFGLLFTIKETYCKQLIEERVNT